MGGAMEELANCQEAYNDVASKYGSESPMATALKGQLEGLQKQ